MQCACAILASVACPALQNFATLSHKRHDFRKKKKITEHKMCVSIFSTTFVWNNSHSTKNRKRYDDKCICVYIQSTRYSCPILMKLEFPRHIFEKCSNIKFHENPSSGSWSVPCGQTRYSSAPSSGPPGGISKHASRSKWRSSRYRKIKFNLEQVMKAQRSTAIPLLLL